MATLSEGLRGYRSTAIGFLAAGVVFAVLFWLVGGERVLEALSRADPALVAMVATLLASWIVVQGLALRTVLSALGIPTAARTAVMLFAGAAFANNVTPFGQAGGEPIGALLVRESTDAEYETGLAAIASAEALNFLPSTVLALCGVLVYATTATLDPRLRVAAGAVVLFGLCVAVVGGATWRYRDAVERVLVRVAIRVVSVAARILPPMSPPERDGIERSVRQFFAGIERVAGDRRRLPLALGFSTLGLVVQALATWCTFRALGSPIPLAVPFFVIPVGTMAAVGPFPGGLGSTESAHLLLLASTTGVAAPVIAAAVVIYRLGGFFLTITVGGGSIALLGARSLLP